MKKALFLLILTLFVAALQASADDTKLSRRQSMIERYAPKNVAAEQHSGVIGPVTVEKFFEAVRKGNTDFILTLTQPELFVQTDKFGNNCFHLAKDAATIQMLSAMMRRLDNQNFREHIRALRNQRNDMGETPLMAHINYGKADTFKLLYEGSDLADAIRSARAVDKGGALGDTAKIKKGIARAKSKDASGRTVAQAALANADKPGMGQVIAYFETYADFLF